MLKRLLVFGVLMVCAQASRAVVVQFDHVTGVDWVYNILLDPGTSMRADADPTSTAQNGFTVYDFPGLVDAEFTPDAAVADRTFLLTTPGLGFTPPGIGAAPSRWPTSMKPVTKSTGAGQLVDHCRPHPGALHRGADGRRIGCSRCLRPAQAQDSTLRVRQSRTP